MKSIRMKKVLIIGCCGSGKTTLAKQLGAKTGLPVYHLDHLWWKPGWIQTDREEFDRKLTEVLNRDSWIIDGNFKRTLPRRLKHADTVIYLDYPKTVCLKRGFLRQTGKPHEVAPGCPDRLDFNFLRRIWTFRKTTRPEMEEQLAGYTGRLLRFRTPEETETFQTETF